MVGDARRKGGSYSDNPNTARTRRYLKNQTPEQRALKSKVFSEYRAFRTTCIKRSSMSDYIYERSRDVKLKMLSDAVNTLIANRAARNIDYFGTHVEEFITRFHDKAFLKSIGKANAVLPTSGEDSPMEGYAAAPNSTAGIANPGQLQHSEQEGPNNVDAQGEHVSEEMLAISEFLDRQAKAQKETCDGLALLLNSVGF
ncbi:hypothetical protein CORC01_05408 [Colletotrichum orchidophilum]|uniref:Uncharacterized protein n=1 Tax=Colletotrichum orchidophilum TaxID=1209926 RepID=A0A1G4BDB9_9PEZI|nr:uncharacterized protein CORC01_05408 [Colletotrichum orchidophilum]OHE99367.1 hypothetical protein CORC01_05408 [Colletotrichum orchidophilum]